MTPNGDVITYNITSVPAWVTLTLADLSLVGTPSDTDVGTFTIIVTGKDTKNETAASSFVVDVQKNYYPVVQKQVDD